MLTALLVLIDFTIIGGFILLVLVTSLQTKNLWWQKLYIRIYYPEMWKSCERLRGENILKFNSIYDYCSSPEYKTCNCVVYRSLYSKGELLCVGFDHYIKSFLDE